MKKVGLMNYKSDHIEELCKELMELGIIIEPRTMELILHFQEQEFKDLTKGIDPVSEFEHFLSNIK